MIISGQKHREKIAIQPNIKIKKPDIKIKPDIKKSFIKI